ncbi:MAG: hypothetical protein ACFCUE_15405 [Candidatus Bathyarchaeia archaeon]|jgi:hypothetical protein
MTNQKIDTNNLQKMAQASEDKEAYQLIAKTGRYRIGVGARLPQHAQTPVFFIEIVVNMCPACSKVDLSFLGKALNVLRSLEQNGYTLTCQDDNSILCEKLTSEKTLQNELEAAKECNCL